MSEQTLERMQASFRAMAEENKRLATENTELRTRRFVRFNQEECWIYDITGENHLESLVCPVVISAVELSRILLHSQGEPRNGIEASAKLLERKAEEYAHEFGGDDMGALSFGKGEHAAIKLDYYNNLLELADEIRGIAPKGLEAVPLINIRAAFERWYYGDGTPPAHTFERGSDGESYKFIAIQSAWTTWQGAAATLVMKAPEAVPLSDRQVHEILVGIKFVHGYNYVMDCVRAIEQAHGITPTTTGEKE